WKNALNEPAIGGIVINCHDITERKHSEETLKLISATVEQTADCVVITDKNGIIQYVNEAFVKETGYSREEAIGKTPRILSSGQHSPKFFESLWKTILSGEVFSATFINKRKDGELIYEDKTITPIKDKEGNITHFVSTAKNISEQLRAEETLRKKDERHKVVIENIFKFIPEGVLVLTESLNLLKQNKAFDDIVQKYAALLGYTEQELAEMIIRQLRTKIVTGNSNQPEADEPLTQEIHIGKNDQLEPDPSGRDKLILQFNTARMFLAEEEEEEEEEATIVISLSDVTERKTAEDLLHKSEAKFRKLISSLPDAVLVVNTEGRITLFNNNATKIFGYTQDEMLNCTIEDLIPKHNREHHLEERNKYLSKPASRAMGEGRELFALRKDGSEFPTEIMLEPVEINNKLVILTIVRDVTTRKKMLEDLIAAKDTAEAANSLKDAFIANISHEIRTPLNGILGLTSLIKDIYSQYIQEEDKELFSGIEDSSKRIIRTVDMILNYSRLQVGEFPISPEVLNLSSICGSLINEFKAAAESASIALAFENKSENANIFADDYSITQIISNLIDNAIKYTKKGYVKVILYNESNDELLLDIKDSGIGIAEDYLNEIFVPYIQEEMGYGRAYEGVGLGLPLVNQFIELNNIKISVVSKKGVGTTFTINFGKGVNALEETETKDVKTADQRQEAQKNIQVLLVEDDAANQITVQRFLGSRYSVLTA
ncbi:MAG: PAS domain S-box protein, partial [Bacteroidetes bacterium]|nr:PAS domain S-box protein [Bacteroidota bacterium]